MSTYERESVTPPPRQGPRRWDRRTWAHLVDPGETEESHALTDQDIDLAWESCAGWLVSVAEALGDGPGLADLTLPHPDPERLPIRVGLVDGDQFYMLIAGAQLRGEEVANLYVGLVSQELSSRWVGVAGFYLPTCPACGHRKTTQRLDRLLDHVGGLGFVEVAASRLPDGLRPRPGWFDNRLHAVLAHPSASRRTPWAAWPPTVSRGAFLVRTGPAVTNLDKVVMRSSRSAAEHLPRQLGADSKNWTWSAGRLADCTAALHRPA